MPCQRVDHVIRYGNDYVDGGSGRDKKGRSGRLKEKLNL